MTFGEKLKQLRTNANLTQKELADRLNVTFQTVSKWENDTNEPDISTLKELTKIFNVSVEYFFNEDAELEESKETTEEIVVQPVIAEDAGEVEKKKIGTCHECGKDIFEGEVTHNVEHKSSSGIKEFVTICDDCFKAKEEAANKRIQELQASMTPSDNKKSHYHEREDKKVIVWGIVIGIILSVIALIVCILNYSKVGIGWTIGAPIIIGLVAFADIYCIFTASYISDVFMEVASWSIKFPGVIFSFDLDGLKFLIAMKILFAIAGALIGIAVFLLALAISSVLSVFSVIPLLIYNR